MKRRFLVSIYTLNRIGSDDIAKAYKHFQELTHSYEFGAVGKRTEAAIADDVKKAQKDILHSPFEKIAPGWDRLIQTMIDKAQ